MSTKRKSDISENNGEILGALQNKSGLATDDESIALNESGPDLLVDLDNEQGKVPGERTLPRGLYITIKIGEGLSAKRKIAQYVVEHYVHDFDAVLLDAGSTAEIIAEEMFEKRKFLSVLTNNMGAYAAYTRAGEADKKNPVNQGNELLISGGRYVDVYESLLGDEATPSIEAFTPNIIILGTSGLRWDEGIFCHGSEESTVKHLLWTKPTDIRLIATDWTKIGKRDARTFGKLPDFKMNTKKAVIVTNVPPRELYNEDPKRAEEFDVELNRLEKAGIIVHKVGTGTVGDR